MTQDLNFDPRTTAIVWIDLQHGIVERELAPRLGLDVAGRAAALSSAARAAGSLVVYVHVDLNATLRHPADKPAAAPGGVVPARAMEIVPVAGYQPETDLLVLKRQWGAFYGTALEQMLRRRGVRTIVLGGIATNLGVESTARAALDRGYELIFVEDAMTSRSAEMHQFTVETIFPIMGRVRTAAEVQAAFSTASG